MNHITQISEIKMVVDSYLLPLKEENANLNLKGLAIVLDGLIAKLDKLWTSGVEDVYADIKSSAAILHWGRVQARKPEHPLQMQEIYNRLMGASSKLYRYLNPETSFNGKTDRNNFYISHSN